MHLTWNEPGGNWNGFRLTRSRHGYPVNETDGELVLSYPTGYVGPTGGQYTDSNLAGGWYYYSVFLYDVAGAEWVRASTVDVLLPFDFESTAKIWDTIPEYYKSIRDDGAGYSQQKFRINPAIYLNNEETVPNLTLTKYLHLFGWGMDMLRTQAEGVRDGYDIDTVHFNRMGLLAAQFGASVEGAAPASTNRTMIRNLGWLYRMRGTIDGIRELLTLVTGWDLTVTLGPNLMLSEDYADAMNPQPQLWDPTVRYVTGDRVRYNDHLYQALQTAYGQSTAPSGTLTDNAYWNATSFVEPSEVNSTQRADTGDVGTWQIQGPSGWVAGGTHIGQGTTDPENGLVTYQNAITFRNEGSAGTVTLRSIPRRSTALTSWDKQLVIESGIPVPRPRAAYDSTERYHAGDTALYMNAPYEATATVQGENPDTSTSWRRLGYDDRARLALSFYSHGPWSGTPGSGGLRENAVVTEFDENGDFIAETICNPASFANTYFDPFNTTGSVTNGRVPAKGAAWSANGVGTWGQSKDSNGGYAFPPATGRSYQLAPATLADTNVAVTFRTVPGASRLMGVIFRWSDANNFWVATNTGLYKVVAGAARANPASGALTYATFVAGQRMKVTLSGNTIQVYKNGTLLGTATDAFNATATRHGIEVEA